MALERFGGLAGPQGAHRAQTPSPAPPRDAQSPPGPPPGGAGARGPAVREARARAVGPGPSVIFVERSSKLQRAFVQPSRCTNSTQEQHHIGLLFLFY